MNFGGGYPLPNRIQKMTGSGKYFILTATLLLLGVAVFFVDGCAKIPLAYRVSSVSRVSGNVSVSEFKYLPAEIGKVKPFQVSNTAWGNLKFKKDINVFFREAVTMELLSGGVKQGDSTRMLGGEIEDFLIDDSGYKTDCTLKVHYLIKNIRTDEIAYSSTKTTLRGASKLADLNSILNELVRLNIKELLKDEAFIKAIN